MDYLVNNAAVDALHHLFTWKLIFAFSLSRSHFPIVPQAILTKLFHLSSSTRSVTISKANIKSAGRETDLNVKAHTHSPLESPAWYSANYFLPSVYFYCHRANEVRRLRHEDTDKETDSFQSVWKCCLSNRQLSVKTLCCVIEAPQAFICIFQHMSSVTFLISEV